MTSTKVENKSGTVNLIDDFSSIFGGSSTSQPTTTQPTSTSLLTNDIFGNFSGTPTTTTPSNVFNLIPDNKPTTTTQPPQDNNAFNLLNNLGNVN
jgi:hypothetical protein